MKSALYAAIAAIAILAGLPAAQAASSASPTLVVHISNFAFKPADAAIVAGQSVEFVNDDQVAHTVTAADKSFDSGDLAAGGKWTHTFESAGFYKYACSYHSSMVGTLTVKPN